MKTIPISQCSKKWSFLELETSSPLLPGHSWCGQVISGFSSEFVVELDHLHFSQALSACYPKMIFTVFALLHEKTKEIRAIEKSEWEGLANHYGWRWNDQFEKALSAVSKAPKEFQNWAIEKKFNARDWSQQISLSENDFDFVLLEVARRNLSYNQGRTLLDEAIDLHLSGKSDELLPFDGERNEDWLDRIHQLRYPASSEADAKAKQALREVAKPPHANVHWQRQGDISGLKFEFFAYSHNDYVKRIKAIERFEENFQGKLGPEWTI